MVRDGEMVRTTLLVPPSSGESFVGRDTHPGLVSFDHSPSMGTAPPEELPAKVAWGSSAKHKRHHSLFDFSSKSNSGNRFIQAAHTSPDIGNRIDLDSDHVQNITVPSTTAGSSHHELRKAPSVKSSRRDWRRLLPFDPDSLYYHHWRRPKDQESLTLVRGSSDGKLLVKSEVENNNSHSEKQFMGADGPGVVATATAHFTSLGVSVSSEQLSGEMKPAAAADGNLQSEELPELAARWREIQGSKDWAGLLDPLDLDLRKEILRYGDFAQMTYDNFDSESHSKYAGSPRFPKQELFERLHNSTIRGYEVTRYLYALVADNPIPGTGYKSRAPEPWDLHSNWVGFVAVSTDAEEIRRLGRRDIVIACRSSVGTMEWLVAADPHELQMATVTQLLAAQADGHQPPPPPGPRTHSKSVLQRPKVEKAFWSLYTSKLPQSNFNQESASEQVIAEVRRLLELYKGEELSITITGHGLGGALAILTAYEISETRLNQRRLDKHDVHVEADKIPVTIITFGSPRIGDSIFKWRFEEMQLKALRVVNVHDLVPKSIGGRLQPPWGRSYKHVGVELQVNHKLSTYMKHTRDPLDWHNLECYLHLVDGFQGFKSNEFKLVTGRDYGLINKASNVLKDEYCIPGFWWQLENKGLICNSAGHWVQPNRPFEDDPTLANSKRFI